MTETSTDTAPTTPTAPTTATGLRRARTALLDAELAESTHQRFLTAYAVCLQIAAVVLACRSRPGRRPTGRPRNTWQVLAAVAPELAEWAAFFAATQPQRDAVADGHHAAVTPRQTDDLVRDATAFLTVVQRRVDARRPGGDGSVASLAARVGQVGSRSG